jgi:hypothetical protein
MVYIIPITLTLVSYLFGVYFANQGLRDEISRPLIYSSDFVIMSLIFLFSWVPMILALYLGFRNTNWITLVVLLLMRFTVLPTFFNNKIKRFMDKKSF